MVVIRTETLPPPALPDVPLEEMLAPRPARQVARHAFNPVTGPFRRLERAVSMALARHVFPRIPGLEVPYSRQLERALVLSRCTVRLRGLPVEHDGIRLLLITDVHAGPFLAPSTLERAFARLTRVGADVVLLGGDVATTRLADVRPALRAFRLLAAPQGVFGVLGNHDHYTEDPERLVGLLEEQGVRMLQNRGVTLGRLGLAGIDDLVSGRPDLDRALEATRGRTTVLLSHNPDVFFEAAARGVSLVLSGHTHGGQMRLPHLPVLVRQSRFRLDAGRYRFGDAELVVSRGFGATGLPLRVACAPEAVLVTLRHGAV